jgi:Amt family ammonium transporter
VTLAYSFVVSFVIAKVIDMVIGIRVPEEDEMAGLDLTQHAETAYSFGELGSMGRVS